MAPIKLTSGNSKGLSSGGSASRRSASGRLHAQVAQATTYVVKRGEQRVLIEGRSVFEDLGFSTEETSALLSGAVDEVMQRRSALKTQLVDEINAEIACRHLSIAKAAVYLSVSRPRLSDITHGKLEKFSLDAVVDLMHKFGKEVRLQIVDARATAGSGEKRIRAAARA